MEWKYGILSAATQREQELNCTVTTAAILSEPQGKIYWTQATSTGEQHGIDLIYTVTTAAIATCLFATREGQPIDFNW